MIKALLNWADDRTGYRTSLNEALYERIPGGARWRYVFGSMLVFAFVTQMITGMILWMCYSPGSQNAYESVYWIQNELTLGWLLRGIGAKAIRIGNHESPGEDHGTWQCPAAGDVGGGRMADAAV